MSCRCPLPRLSVACLAAIVTCARGERGATPAVATQSSEAPTNATLETVPPDSTAATAAGPKQVGPPESSASLPAGTSDPGPLVKYGESLAQRNDFAGAESTFRHVLNAAASTPQDTKHALLALAQMHRRQGALTKSAAIYERYLKEYPGDEYVPDALLDLGRTLRGLGIHRLALTRFYSVINSTLKLPSADFARYQALAKTAQFEIAETHFEAGDYTEAAKFYGRLSLLELTPTDAARVQFKMARAQQLHGDLDEAVVSLRSFIERWPADENVPEARYILATTLQELRRPQEAFTATLELLQSAQAGAAKNATRWAYWQRRTGNQLANHFFETGDIVNAQAIYAGLLGLSTEPSWKLPTSYQLALCFERLGQVDRARLAYQGIVDAAGAEPAPEIEELARMAAWRLEHLSWRERTAEQVSSLLETKTGQQSTRVSHAPATPSAHATHARSPGT